MKSAGCFSRLYGFTLVELLAVICVMVLLLAFSLPAVGNLLSSRATDQAISELAGLVEYARREAITLQTYTWVGIEEKVDTNGHKSLRAAVYLSPIGSTKSLSSGGKSYVNGAKQISRAYHWKEIELIPPSALDRIALPNGMTLETLPAQPISGMASGSGRNITTEPMQLMTFTPGGYAFLIPLPRVSDPYGENIGIAMRQIQRGDEALLYLNGLNGAVKVLR